MRKIYNAVFYIIILLNLTPVGVLYSQDSSARKDTVRITIIQAEEKFINNNLQLLAAKFNIDAAKASVIQAELLPNPNLAVEQNIYNQYTGKFFDVTASGNTSVQVQQLIQLAGKRGKQTDIARFNSMNAEYQFREIVRNLRFNLRSDLLNLFFLQQSMKFYNLTIPSVKNTVESTNLMYEKNAILLSEVLRLKSLLFTLENERLSLLNQISQIQADLRVLMRDSLQVYNYYIADIDTVRLYAARPDTMNFKNLVDQALENRYDYKIAENTYHTEEANLKLQKSLAVPDVTLGVLWTRAGSYIPNYWALTASIDLPVFNRNQGNIKLSENLLESDNLLMQQSRQNVEHDVEAAYHRALEVENLYRNLDKAFPNQYNFLVEGMNHSYERRNVTIIEFTDFYESYRSSMLQLNQLRSDRAAAFEMLNYVTGKTIIDF